MSGRNSTSYWPEQGAPEGRRGVGRGLGAPVSSAREPDGREPSARPEPPSRRDPMAWAIVALGVYVACSLAWWASGLGDAAMSSRVTGAATLPGALIVVLLALRIRKTTRLDERTRRAWSLIGAAVVCYVVGALIHVRVDSAPVLSIWPIGMALEIATYPLVAIGLALLPKPSRSLYDVALFGLDLAIVAWSVAMLLWHFFFFPIASSAGQSVLETVDAAFYPVADLAILYAIVAIVLRGLRESSRAALTVAGMAFVLVFFGDLASGVDQIKGSYVQGGLVGMCFSVAWAVMAVATYLQWRIKDDDKPIGGLADYSRSVPWLPYVAVAIGFLAPAIRDWNNFDALRQHVPATGLLIALVITRLSVTARQNASLAAAERGRLAAAVDQAAEAILTTDRAGHVTYVNLAFTRITGYTAREIVGGDPDLLRRLADPEPMAEMTQALIRGENWAGRLVLKRRDGVTVDIDMAVAPLHNSSGVVTGSVAAARDISRERALEVQLAQAQKMEAVGRLAGGIAHDFNNILTAISGFGELAAAELPPDDPIGADIEQIIRATERAATLTRALLAFSRRQVMQTRLTDLNEVVGGLTPMLGRLIGEDVRLTVRLDPHLGLIMADRAQLEQVVLNLAINARDAMAGGGKLTIATDNGELDAEFARSHIGAVEGAYVKLTVSDTGSGMTPDVMEHIFEPFFTTKERGKGTGLGLSTAIGIVQQSEGFVDVASEPGVGSTFTIYLPRLEGASAPDETVEARIRPNGGTETILVAEDEEAVRAFVERVLANSGYAVLTAADGASALEKAARLPRLDLLFTDVVMPGMSGIHLAAQLAGLRPGLPVIYASGYLDEGILRAAGEEGVPYLPKPFTADELLARVREVLDRPDAHTVEPLSEPTVLDR